MENTARVRVRNGWLLRSLGQALVSNGLRENALRFWSSVSARYRRFIYCFCFILY